MQLLLQLAHAASVAMYMSRELLAVTRLHTNCWIAAISDQQVFAF